MVGAHKPHYRIFNKPEISGISTTLVNENVEIVTIVRTYAEY